MHLIEKATVEKRNIVIFNTVITFVKSIWKMESVGELNVGWDTLDLVGTSKEVIAIEENLATSCMLVIIKLVTIAINKSWINISVNFVRKTFAFIVQLKKHMIGTFTKKKMMNIKSWLWCELQSAGQILCPNKEHLWFLFASVLNK